MRPSDDGRRPSSTSSCRTSARTRTTTAAAAKTAIAQFDAFLPSEVPLIQNADHNALIIITFDEGTSNKGPASSKQFAGGGNIVFLALGPQVAPGVYDAPSNHYGLLRTLEDGYGGLPHLANAQTAPTIDEIWQP